MEKEKFDYESFKQNAVKEVLRKKRNGEKISIDELTKPILKEFLETLLDTEMQEYMDEEERNVGNRKNGKFAQAGKKQRGCL